MDDLKNISSKPDIVQSDDFFSSLESIYGRYGQGIYTLCLRLIGDRRAAESATVAAFVQFSKELASQTDEARVILRLRELAVGASLARLNHKLRIVIRHGLLSARSRLHWPFGPK